MVEYHALARRHLLPLEDLPVGPGRALKLRWSQGSSATTATATPLLLAIVALAALADVPDEAYEKDTATIAADVERLAAACSAPTAIRPSAVAS